MIFQSFSSNPKTHLQRDPWPKFQNHTKYPWFPKRTLEVSYLLQCSPWAACSSPTAESPAGDGRTWPTGVPGVPRGLTHVDLRRISGQSCRRRAPTTGRRRCACWSPACLSYGPPWAHYIGGYQDRLLGGPLGLPGLRRTAPEGVKRKDYTGVVLG
jgi:hypothetical protein